jgi:hypothetical protein
LLVGFLANFETKNVTISLIASPVPLMSVNNWIIVLSRVSESSFPVKLTSAAYVDGFGDIQSNFWLGLDKIYKLTNMAVNRGYMFQLRFEVQSATSSTYVTTELKL